MAVITPVEVTLAGVTPHAGTAAGLTNTVAWHPGLQITVENTHSSGIVATVVAIQESDQGVLHDATMTVALTSGKNIIGRIPERFKDALGNVNVNLDDATSATIKASYHGSVDVPDITKWRIKMAEFTPTELSLTSVTPPTGSAMDLTNTVTWARGLEITVANTHTADIDVTIVAQVADSQGVLNDKVITVPLTSGVKQIGPIPVTYRDGLGKVHVNIDDATAATLFATSHDVTVR
jgi:hypothetical protein